MYPLCSTTPQASHCWSVKCQALQEGQLIVCQGPIMYWQIGHASQPETKQALMQSILPGP